MPNERITEKDILWDNLEDWEIPIIKAGTGKGKTHFATTELTKHLGKEILFPLSLVPITSIKEQSVREYEQAEYWSKLDFLCEQPHDNRMRVACFSTIAQWLADGNEINNCPDLLILDEIDLLAKWSMCFENYLLAWDWILTNLDKMKVIGLSATPELLIDYVDTISFGNIARELPANYQAKRVEVIQHSSVITYLKSLKYSPDNKVLVYLQAAKDCVRLAEQYPNAGFLISKYNEDTLENGGEKLNEMMMNQKVSDWHAKEDNLRDYVLNNEKLPDGYDLLFFNDANLVGVNIKDENVKHVICETVEQSAIVQSIGRVRHDLETITVITNNRNKKPFFEDLERATEFFTDEQIDLYTWWKTEQLQIKEDLKSRKQVKRDILTYRGLDGNIKVNPFAKACYDYMLDIYERLDDAETAKEYFEETLLPFAANGAIVYVEADEIRQKAMNENRFDESILSEFMNRDLFTADKKMLCDKIKLVDKQRHNRKWPIIKSYLIEKGYNVREGKKKNPQTGKQARYSIITW